MSTNRFVGKAQDIQQVDTYEFTGTWAAGDTASWTINEKTLTLTVDGASTATIAQQAMEMFKAKNVVDGIVASETRNFGGQEIAEFTELDVKYGVSVSGSILTLKWTAGVPVTIVSSVVTAGNGDITHVAATAATGKNFFDNADNWSSGSLPSAADTILFDQGSIDVKYALNNTTERLNLIRTNNYTGNIGLPAINPLGYPEYRQRYLDLPNTTTTGSQGITIGSLGNNRRASGITRLDLGSNTGSALGITVYDAAAFDGESAVQIVGGNIAVYTVYRGSLDIGWDQVGSAADLAELYTSYISNRDTDAYVRVGSTVDWEGTPILTCDGGTVYLQSADGSPTLTIKSGTVVMDTAATGNMGTTSIYEGGTLSWLSGTFVPTIFGGGTVDMRMGVTSLTSSSQPVFHKGYRYYDSKGRADWSNGIDFSGCIPGNDPATGQVFDVIQSKNWKMSAI